MWEFEVDSREIDGLLDVVGPYVHGRPGARFLYLSWGAVSGAEFATFRRIKLMFGDVPTELLRAVHDDGGVLVGRLGLTDGTGGPRAARVRPPDVVWDARRPSAMLRRERLTPTTTRPSAGFLAVGRAPTHRLGRSR
jgi:hypothetical protein